MESTKSERREIERAFAAIFEGGEEYLFLEGRRIAARLHQKVFVLISQIE